MILLNDSEPFAIGGRRACYRHPDDATRCIKLTLANADPVILRAADPWWKRLRPIKHYDENKIDSKIQHLLDSKLDTAANYHFPKIHGLVETDLGLGLETELICDADARISLSGKEFTMQNGLTEASEEALDNLRCFLVQHLILFRDPFPHNMVFQSLEGGRLRAVIIDGLGRHVFLSPILRNAAEKRVEKKFARLMKGLKRAEQNAIKGIQPKPNGMLAHR
jgi:hypothetical protein